MSTISEDVIESKDRAQNPDVCENFLKVKDAIIVQASRLFHAKILKNVAVISKPLCKQGDEIKVEAELQEADYEMDKH